MPGRVSRPLIGYLPNFLRARFCPTSISPILRLPFDIHVEYIFPYLFVEDIICLRRVNKSFFLLTHEPIIWKNFLRELRIPLPPIRPTFNYSLQSTDYEVEQLVTRAISLEDNWRREQPTITNSSILLAHYRVLDMKLLPGGRYLIASVKDADGCRFFIYLFDLDHPRGHQAVARIQTISKAFHLQARYMTYLGKPGIMVAYVQRRFSQGGPVNVDPSDFGFKTDIDPPYPFRHELMCQYIEMDTLDALGDPELYPGSSEYKALAQAQGRPFLEVATLVGKDGLSNITLFERNGLPYVTVVQQPNQVYFVDVTNKTMTSLLCYDHEDYPGKPHHIQAVRVLPSQDELIVIRSVQCGGKEVQVHAIEIYGFPRPQEPTDWGLQLAEIRYTIRNQKMAKFHISDDDNLTSIGENPLVRDEPPPPISIFMETTEPNGVVHHKLWPTPYVVPATSTQPEKTLFNYTLDDIVPQTTHICDPLVTRVLPGVYRALMYTVFEGDRKDAPSMVSLRRYVSPEVMYNTYTVPRVDRSATILRKKHPLVPQKSYCTFPLDPLSQDLYQSGGVAAITWDEGIGRVCIAAEKEEQIQILDFAHMVRPDIRFARWKRNQTLVLHDFTNTGY